MAVGDATIVAVIGLAVNVVDIAGSKGFGMKIVDSLVKQLSGRLSIIQQDRGTGFLITFPRSA